MPGVIPSETVCQVEREQLFDQPRPAKALQGVGLAISGGGIRSASFALGVFQALLGRGIFERFDYLSTVSGGGYLGSTISWMRKQSGGATNPSEAFVRQFGSAASGMRSGDEDWRGASGAPGRRYVWLDFIRSHGNYLRPGGISALGLAATVLRGALFNLCVYGGVATALFALLIGHGGLPGLNLESIRNAATGAIISVQAWAAFFGLLAGMSIVLYGAATWLASLPATATVWFGLFATLAALRLSWFLWHWEAIRSGAWASYLWPILTTSVVIVLVSALLLGMALQAKGEMSNGRTSQHWHYLTRVAYTRLLGTFCGLFFGLLLIWSLPYAFDALVHLLTHAVATATVGGALGAIGGIYQAFRGRSDATVHSTFASLRIAASAALLIYGLGLTTYWLGAELARPDATLPYWILLVAVVAGFLVNTNYFGLGRLYRDRLMETFMPNASAVEQNRWSPATEADDAALVDFRKLPSGGVQRPLHLINCNAVLVDSANDRFRGRGGDSFVLSPLFSGCDATGYVATGNLADGTLTLASAVAISGAAANPDAAVAGQGVTRNRLVSFLMSMLNVRLGYWIPNPSESARLARFFGASLWWPGLRQGLFGQGLSERAAFIELTDGGHFENTALYELIRRRVEVIVVSQAGQDANFTMDDLANAIERVRADFGVHIRFDDPKFGIDNLRPDATIGAANRGYAIGKIRYPNGRRAPTGEPDYDEGAILYLQATPVASMHPDTQSYWRRHKEFPNQSTADQFFGEEQLEAYRELGLRITRTALDDISHLQAPRYPHENLLTGLLHD